MADASRAPAESPGRLEDATTVETIEADIDEAAVLESVGPPTVDSTIFPFDHAKQKADTARNIAYALVVILGASVFLHYVVISLTPLPAESALRLEAYKAAFNAWLPVASGLVSAAVTYYFTRDRDDKK